MTAFNPVFDILKRLKADISKEKVVIEREIDAKIAKRDNYAQELKQVRDLPRPRAEVIAEIEGLFEGMHQEYLARLGYRLRGLAGSHRSVNPQGAMTLNLLGPLAGVGEVENSGYSGATLSREVTYDSVIGLFWPAIKVAVRESLEAMPYPEKVGLPTNERPGRAKELTKKIEALNKEIQALLDEAEVVGISFDED